MPENQIKYNEEEILKSLSEGDERAIEAIYQLYWEPLFVKSFSILRDREICEDIIQEIFIKLWDFRERLEIKVSLKAYLFASCRYSIYRHIRSGTVRENIFDEIHERLHTSSSHADLEYKEILAQVNYIINQLPPKCQQVYKLSREENLSHKEIAQQLHISTKTVENHITRALHELRSSLRGITAMKIIFFFFLD